MMKKILINLGQKRFVFLDAGTPAGLSQVEINPAEAPQQPAMPEQLKAPEGQETHGLGLVTQASLNEELAKTKDAAYKKFGKADQDINALAAITVDEMNIPA